MQEVVRTVPWVMYTVTPNCQSARATEIAYVYPHFGSSDLENLAARAVHRRRESLRRGMVRARRALCLLMDCPIADILVRTLRFLYN